MSRSYTVTEAELHSLAARVAGSMAACLQEGVTFVSGDEVDRFLKSRTETKVSGEVTDDQIAELIHVGMGFQSGRLTKDAAIKEARDFLASFQNPAPQSPVVPGAEEILGAMGIGTARWRDESWDNPSKKESQYQAEAIHAHLLANARESRDEWSEAGLTPQQMWDEIQEIRKITGDDGTHGSPSNLVRSMAEALATVGKEG